MAENDQIISELTYQSKETEKIMRMNSELRGENQRMMREMQVCGPFQHSAGLLTCTVSTASRTGAGGVGEADAFFPETGEKAEREAQPSGECTPTEVHIGHACRRKPGLRTCSVRHAIFHVRSSCGYVH